MSVQLQQWIFLDLLLFRLGKSLVDSHLSLRSLRRTTELTPRLSWSPFALSIGLAAWGRQGRRTGRQADRQKQAGRGVLKSDPFAIEDVLMFLFYIFFAVCLPACITLRVAFLAVTEIYVHICS
jgi:hypothetical protein